MNGRSSSNYTRFKLNKAAALLGGLSEQAGEVLRRMNLPAHHQAALPPKSLMAVLVILREETGRAEQLLTQAISEIRKP